MNVKAPNEFKSSRSGRSVSKDRVPYRLGVAVVSAATQHNSQHNKSPSLWTSPLNGGLRKYTPLKCNRKKERSAWTTNAFQYVCAWASLDGRSKNKSPGTFTLRVHEEEKKTNGLKEKGEKGSQERRWREDISPPSS